MPDKAALIAKARALELAYEDRTPVRGEAFIAEVEGEAVLMYCDVVADGMIKTIEPGRPLIPQDACITIAGGE
jgi:hypothetical protein